jgi:hypothetical protein
VTGDVLADLRVVEGPCASGPLALEGGWFHVRRLREGTGRPTERVNIPKARSLLSVFGPEGGDDG